MTFERDRLLDYVIGALTPEQEQEIAQYLNEHPEEAAWVRDMFETFADVALAQEPEALPEAAEDALLARIRGSRQAETVAQEKPQAQFQNLPEVQEQPAGNITTLPTRPKAPPWTAFALAAAIALFAWVGLRPAYQSYAVGRQLDQACGEVSVTCQVLVDEANEDLGTLARRANNELFLVLNEEPPEGQVYQAWEIVGDTPQSLGVWDGRVLEISQPLSADSVFGVSIEPAGGSPLPTTPPIVVVPLSG